MDIPKALEELSNIAVECDNQSCWYRIKDLTEVTNKLLKSIDELTNIAFNVPTNYLEQYERGNNRKQCIWKIDDGYETSCGKSVFFGNNRTPKGNDYKFCPYCGMKIEVRDSK